MNKDSMKYISRKLSKSVVFCLKKAPVVFVNGPRQSGKSTLVQKLAEGEFPAHYISFDNITQIAAATNEPREFLTTQGYPLILDEIQMVPDLFRPIKELVDNIRRKDKENSYGRFLLTGSANIMALPQLSDALVGRMSVKTLYPFSVSEVLNGNKGFLKKVFKKDFQNVKDHSRYSLNECISLATFPDISGKTTKEYSEWFESYLTTLLQRDVRTLSQLKKISILPDLLRVLASRTGGLINETSISRDVGLNAVTGKDYRCILQAMFLTFSISPWYRNVLKRLTKSSKGYLTDTLLLCHLQGWKLNDLRRNKPDLYGRVVENFVATELVKLISFSELSPGLLHFRTSDNKEVDFILELPDGQLAAIEVKTSEKVNESDFRGIKIFRELALKNFVCGVVLYSGREVVPFGKDLFAVPFQALWQ